MHRGATGFSYSTNSLRVRWTVASLLFACSIVPVRPLWLLIVLYYRFSADEASINLQCVHDGDAYPFHPFCHAIICGLFLPCSLVLFFTISVFLSPLSLSPSSASIGDLWDSWDPRTRAHTHTCTHTIERANYRRMFNRYSGATSSPTSSSLSLIWLISDSD